MHALRALILGKSHLALLLIVLALSMKALIPSGYMISGASKVLTITICNDGTGGTVKAAIHIPAKGTSKDKWGDHGMAGGHCPWSALSMAATAGAPPLLLALAFAFILLVGFAPAQRLPFRQSARLRPPLRGPPATA